MIVFAGVMAMTVGCAFSSPEKAYVRKAVKLMDRKGLFASGEEWESAKAEALAAAPATMEEAYEVTRAALRVAGGKHSFISTKENQESRAEEDKSLAPKVEVIEQGIVLVRLPAFSGQDSEENRRYAHAVLDAIPESVPGVIIDLRGNTGGNMYPMIAALHRFLPDGVLLQFRQRRFSMPVSREFVLRSIALEAQPQVDCPVALLTDDHTASSGEAVLLCFRGLENARSFGAPTAGYASANTPHPMPDGSKLVLTESCDVARTGEVFCDDPIEPDELTDCPLEAALAWMSGALFKKSQK